MDHEKTVAERGSVVAGLFRTADEAERALVELKSAGFSRVEISRVDGGQETAGDAPGTHGPSDAAAPSFFAEHDSRASSFVDELTRLRFSKHDAQELVDGLVDGKALVTADAGAELDKAVAILSQSGADIRYTSAGSAHASPVGSSVVESGDDAATDELQLRAERLVVDKQRVQHGEARVRKEIVTEVRSIDVPVTREELVIERHAVTSGGVVDNEPIADETIRIPLTEEKVNISKHTVVREEVEVGTRRVESVENVSDTVRHEELRIDGAATSTSATPVDP